MRIDSQDNLTTWASFKNIDVFNYFKFEDTGVGQWFDYDLGAIIGFKLQDNLGFYTEGKYLNYWDRPSYELKVGLNYQIVGM